ncbi:MAG TPA: hypothetical protein DCR40_13535 [Prolixibacteraceae bacterium]|nr:hypothetical protein [Prolixibacteraceae bacterium]
MKRTILSFFIYCIPLLLFAQENNQGCLDKALPFLTPIEGFYLTDYCKFSEFDSYEFVINRNTSSIKKEGIYREVWFRKKGDSNRHVSGNLILQNHVNAIKAAGGEVVKESDGSVFKIVYNGKEIWIYVNSNTYSTDLDNYGIISIEIPQTTQGTGSQVTGGSDGATGIDRNGSPQSQQDPVTIAGAVNPAGAVGLPEYNFNENVGGSPIPATSRNLKSISEDMTTASFNRKTEKAINTDLNPPNVVLDEISEIKGTSALIKGAIWPSAEGSEIISSGFCWSTNPNPSTADSQIAQRGLMTRLIPATIYYVRGFATTIKGTTYGNELSFNSGQIMGSFYAGGLVFYNDGRGRGLICSETDQETNEAWGCMGGYISRDSGIPLDHLSGYANTNVIVATCHQSHCAARICYDLTLNHFYNWVLPSSSEMSLIRTNLYLQHLGGFHGDDYYWTSSEYNKDQAWAYIFGWADYPLHHGNKDLGAHVRAIRSF